MLGNGGDVLTLGKLCSAAGIDLDAVLKDPISKHKYHAVTTLAPRWHRAGTALAPRWHHAGTTLAPRWHRAIAVLYAALYAAL